MFSSVFFCLGTFGTVSLPHKTQSKTGQTSAINAKVRVNFHNERSRSTTLDPKLMFCCVPFLYGCIWKRFATARNLLQNSPNWCNQCKSLCHDVLLEFFTTIAP